MSIVGAFDAHRRQLTFDYLDTVTGEVKPGAGRPGGTVSTCGPGCPGSPAVMRCT